MRSRRIDEIEAYILDNKTVTLDQVCERFSISKSTIRRDLDEILKKGTIKKIYGGVTAAPRKGLVSFEERNISNHSAKERIAHRAAELVRDNDIIYIDSGTTTMHMIDVLGACRNLTVLTNSLEVILRAVPYENINVISLSGTLNRKTLSFTGPSAEQVLQGYNVSKAFMATTGFTIENGVTNSSPLEFGIKTEAVRRSREVILLADGDKCGIVSLMTYCGLDQINTLVTDREPPEDVAKFLRNKDVEILFAVPESQDSSLEAVSH